MYTGIQANEPVWPLATVCCGHWLRLAAGLTGIVLTSWPLDFVFFSTWPVRPVATGPGFEQPWFLPKQTSNHGCNHGKSVVVVRLCSSLWSPSHQPNSKFCWCLACTHACACTLANMYVYHQHAFWMWVHVHSSRLTRFTMRDASPICRPFSNLPPPGDAVHGQCTH